MNPDLNTGVTKTMRLIWVGVLLTAMLLVLGALLLALRARQARMPPPPVYGSVAEFTLTNADGRPVTLADLRGRVWVADIIFTRCAGPCPRMTAQMKRVQDALPPNSGARLVTLTTDPEFDSPAVLAAYARKFGADTNRWLFLTGAKAEIAKLAVDSLKLTAIEKKPGERLDPADLFIHSTLFVIVDKQARLRGVFETEGEGIEPGAAQARILATIRRLEKER